MQARHITLLVEDLAFLAQAVSAEDRHPALESVVARGRACRLEVASPNHLRFALFGIESTGHLPIAGLTHVSDREQAPARGAYWLRTDPVTLWADMASVVMSGCGFADLDAFERNEIENCIRNVLLEEGMQLHTDHPERWCIALDKPLDFEFPPLDDALGVNVADLLPEHPEAKFWHRLLNEIQVELHNCPVNIRRRTLGRQEINSVWFWGGGFIPEAVPHDLFDTVYSNHPVSRGLALINDCGLKRKVDAEQGHYEADGRTILIDWAVESRDARDELQQAEWLAQPLVNLARNGQIELTLMDGQGNGRIFDRHARRRFWRRSKPLARLLAARSGT